MKIFYMSVRLFSSDKIGSPQQRALRRSPGVASSALNAGIGLGVPLWGWDQF